VARLSSRRVQVPEADELVALGAAAQATACLSGEHPEEVARRWGTSEGAEVEPPAERDTETLARIRTARDATLALHEGG
jgi:xylulokinase